MPWMDLVWCLGGGSSLMESLLRPLFLPHLIKAMRACHDVSVCLLLWIFMKLFWRPHTWFNTWLNTWLTLPTLTWRSTAVYVDCGSTWNWPRPPLYYPSFPPSPCFLSSYLDCSYFTFSTRWIVDLHETALPTFHAHGFSLPFQLITFSTLLSEIKGHHRLPTFQQISLFGWTEQITNHKSPTNRQNAELRLDAISLLMI